MVWLPGFTVRLADAVFPAPASLEVTLPVVLLFNPAPVPLTLMENVHEVFAGKLEPDRPILPPPATTVIVPAGQTPLNPLGVATTSPAGRTSVKLMPVSSEMVFGFVTVKVKLVDPPTEMEGAPKEAASEGGVTTKRVAAAAAPTALWPEVTVLVISTICPAVFACMRIGTMQEELAASVALLKLKPLPVKLAELPEVPQV
jgi:hypothetical protein